MIFKCLIMIITSYIRRNYLRVVSKIYISWFHPLISSFETEKFSKIYLNGQSYRTAISFSSRIVTENSDFQIDDIRILCYKQLWSITVCQDRRRRREIFSSSEKYSSVRYVSRSDFPFTDRDRQRRIKMDKEKSYSGRNCTIRLKILSLDFRLKLWIFIIWFILLYMCVCVCVCVYIYIYIYN